MLDQEHSLFLPYFKQIASMHTISENIDPFANRAVPDLAEHKIRKRNGDITSAMTLDINHHW